MACVRNKAYKSPRWHKDFEYRPMPLTFDTYSHCGFNCLYCLAYYQKSINSGKGGRIDYQQEDAASVDIGKVVGMFRGGNAPEPIATCIRERQTMQWGGLADPFCPIEKRKGVGLQLMKELFGPLKYPLAFCTKGSWFTQDDRYMSLIQANPNWFVRISISNLDPHTAARIDRGCDTPQGRIEALRRLNKLRPGSAGLRLRPFIPGWSDRNNEYLELIRAAVDAGCKFISMGYFCYEARSGNVSKLLERYHRMSDIIGVDLVSLYSLCSRSTGYRVLNPTIKYGPLSKAAELCKKLNVQFYVSDRCNKWLSSHNCYTGLPVDFTGRTYRGNFAEAMAIAQRKGEVHWSDIAPHCAVYGNVTMVDELNTCGYNTRGTLWRTAHKGQRMVDYLHDLWNSPNNQRSPYKYYYGAMQPKGVDAAGDIVYVLNTKVKGIT